MKLAVLGATGGTGRQLVDQALAAGHTVTALVRSPGKLADRTDPRLDVVETDVMDAKSLADGLAGHEAVLSALGPAPRGVSRVCAESSVAIIEAMGLVGMSRLLVVSAAGAHTTGDGLLVRNLVKPILQLVLRHAFADMLEMESVVRGSDVDWTIFWPAMLNDKPRSARYRTAVNRNVAGGIVTRRADLAHAMLSAMDDPSTIRTSIGITS